MPPSFRQVPLTPADRRKIYRKSTFFYIFGIIGAALILLSIYLIFQQFAVFYLILLFLGVLLVIVLAVIHTSIRKEIENGKKNILLGTVSDKKEVYTLKVSSVGSSFSSDFDSEYQLKLEDDWNTVGKALYKYISIGQRMHLEKTAQSGLYLRVKVRDPSPSENAEAAHEAFTEEKELTGYFTQVTEKISSNVKLVSYKPRKSKGESDPYIHYLVIEKQLYQVSESEYERIPIGSTVEIRKCKENDETEQVLVYTAEGDEVLLGES